MKTNMEGDCIWDDNTIWDDDCNWYDNIKGESDQMKLVCSCEIKIKEWIIIFYMKYAKKLITLLKTY